MHTPRTSDTSTNSDLHYALPVVYLLCETWCLLAFQVRLMEKQADSIDLVKRLEATGISAIAVHCRRTTERDVDPARWTELPAICSALSIAVSCSPTQSAWSNSIQFNVLNLQCAQCAVCSICSICSMCSVLNMLNMQSAQSVMSFLCAPFGFCASCLYDQLCHLDAHELSITALPPADSMLLWIANDAAGDCEWRRAETC